jgi:hypothetical protein
MSALLRYRQQPGRFGREIRDDRNPTADRRPSVETSAAKPGDTTGYLVDPRAVAAAIIDRLVAGRVLPPR